MPPDDNQKSALGTKPPYRTNYFQFPLLRFTALCLSRAVKTLPIGPVGQFCVALFRAISQVLADEEKGVFEVDYSTVKVHYKLGEAVSREEVSLKIRKTRC